MKIFNYILLLKVLLFQVYFPRYLSGDIYYRYLSDLISTVQMAQDLPIRKHKRQGMLKNYGVSYFRRGNTMSSQLYVSFVYTNLDLY